MPPDHHFPPDSRAPQARESRAASPGTVAPPHRRPIAQLARADIPSWVKWQLVVPLAAFVLANFVLLQLGGDRWIAGHLYLLEGGHWALKDNLVTSTLVHEVGKRLSALAWLGAMACTVAAWRSPALRTWRKPLLYLVLAVLLSTSIVAWMKSWTHVDCPWDLVGFGGTRGYHDLLAALPPHAPPGRCFPAGHASAGYAWLALFFFFGDTRPRLRWKGLALALGTGLVFGISQQLRGAHFASHDAWTLMVCWLVALLLHRAMFPNNRVVHAHTASIATDGAS